jgi:hypothetical protein
LVRPYGGQTERPGLTPDPGPNLGPNLSPNRRKKLLSAQRRPARCPLQSGSSIPIRRHFVCDPIFYKNSSRQNMLTFGAFLRKFFTVL